MHGTMRTVPRIPKFVCPALLFVCLALLTGHFGCSKPQPPDAPKPPTQKKPRPSVSRNFAIWRFEAVPMKWN